MPLPISAPTNVTKPAINTFSPSVESALINKAVKGGPETFANVVLRAPDGSFWIVTVDSGGHLRTEQMQRPPQNVP